MRMSCSMIAAKNGCGVITEPGEGKVFESSQGCKVISLKNVLSDSVEMFFKHVIDECGHFLELIKRFFCLGYPE